MSAKRLLFCSKQRLPIHLGLLTNRLQKLLHQTEVKEVRAELQQSEQLAKEYIAENEELESDMDNALTQAQQLKVELTAATREQDHLKEILEASGRRS